MDVCHLFLHSRRHQAVNDVLKSHLRIHVTCIASMAIINMICNYNFLNVVEQFYSNCTYLRGN